jgi:hypothetical protein
MLPDGAAAYGETLTCSDWQGNRTCQGPGGYRSPESQWQGMATGSDGEGNCWTTSRWQGFETTTVERVLDRRPAFCGQPSPARPYGPGDGC